MVQLFLERNDATWFLWISVKKDSPGSLLKKDSCGSLKSAEVTDLLRFE